MRRWQVFGEKCFRRIEIPFHRLCGTTHAERRRNARHNSRFCAGRHGSVFFLTPNPSYESVCRPQENAPCPAVSRIYPCVDKKAKICCLWRVRVDKTEKNAYTVRTVKNRKTLLSGRFRAKDRWCTLAEPARRWTSCGKPWWFGKALMKGVFASKAIYACLSA